MIHNNASSSEKNALIWIKSDLSPFTSQNCSKQICGWQQEMSFNTSGSIIVDYGLNEAMVCKLKTS